MNIAEAYRAKRAEAQETEIVDVIPPSGFTFKFRKPQVLSFLFRNGLPSNLTAQTAVALDGDQSQINLSPEQQEQEIDLMIKMRDEILNLSIEPKIVLGEATADNEISVGDISDEDLAFFIIWYRNGGNVSGKLDTFRAKPRTNAGNRAHSKKRVRQTK